MDKMKYLLLGVIGILLVTGCTVNQEQPSKLVDTYCDIAKPILLDKSEIPLLTQETKRQILVHNKTYKQKCLTNSDVSRNKVETSTSKS